MERLNGEVRDRENGTAISAAENLHRRWMGIDVTYLAINLVKRRLTDEFPNIKFRVEGEPRDIGGAKNLALRDRYQFQCWALSLISAIPVGSTTANPRQVKKGADEGVDGWLRFASGVEGQFEKIVVQVKSGHVNVQVLREFRDVVIQGQEGAMGIFLTLEDPTSEMIKLVKSTDPYVSPTWNVEYPKIQILTIQELLDKKRPQMPSTISPFQQAQSTKRIDRHIINSKLI